MNRIAALLTDIEGTTTPIAFVHDVLFPYAKSRLAAFCADHANDPVLADVRRLADGRDVLATLTDWMARDEKIAALKTIQGMIWESGYVQGEITGAVYPDVPPALRRWAKAGLRLFVYSSGSVTAQKLLFGHTNSGDLTPLFQGFFDTSAGPKREAASYKTICRGANISPGDLLFLSDVAAELDAAKTAGLVTCQLLRPADGTVADAGHAQAADFKDVARQFSLPRTA
jgi:enolase-phosphatase E1